MYMYTVEQLYVGVYTPKGKWGGGNQQDLCRVAGKIIEDLIKNKDWFDNVYSESCQFIKLVLNSFFNLN